ncbi:nucleolar protein 6-like isoform X2 [Eriocheir sinensis]|uniref:nucleolar protein 6-like isoform X2 n=1 Tax=Eriocheir sinensis TaxID=95602 RepID=UPI0021CA0514|nr:nucleolar protein 6-like isoform X2 [Eriocheir sinensis]
MKSKAKIDEIMEEDESEDFGFVDDDEEEEEEETEDELDDNTTEVQDEHNENNKRTQREQGGKHSKLGKVKEGHSNLYKPPTMDELNMLRETQMLYHSNLFRMQMEEVLSEVSLKEKRHQQFSQWLTKLSSHLTSLPESSSLELSDKKKMVRKGIHDPMLKTMPKVTGSFIFAPPEKVEVVGSFASSTITTLNPTIDVMMILPKKCINASDWRNGRWLTKRVKYLSWIAENLVNKTDIVQKQSWTTHLGASCRPVLQVTPSGELGKKWKVNLYPVPDQENLKISRFSPERSNLQPKWFFPGDVEIDEQPSTPYYNWACAVDVVMQQHQQLVMDHLGGKTNLTQGIKLIKVWLAQRDLDKGMGSFSGHMVTMFVIHLLQSHKISSQMSPYQVFRNAVLNISSTDWIVKGISMCPTQDEKPSLETLHQLYEVVFVDPSGFINLTAMMVAADYQRIQHESQLAISFLDSSSVDSFESLFIKKVETLQMSDQLVSIRLKKEEGIQALMKKKSKHLEDTMDMLGDVRRVLWSSVLAVLNEGLGDRKVLLALKREASHIWPLDQPPPQHSWSLELGLILDPVTAWALLTKGPSAESPEVENFKTFWGEQCSLRRFQDGSFHEAVLWGSPSLSQAQRRLIPEKICKDVLYRHFGVKEENILYVAKQTESILHWPEYKMSFEYSTGEEATLQAIQAFDSLSRQLRSLDLPLKITAVQPKSDVNRHTRVFPPLAKAVPISGQIVEVAEDHLQFSEQDGPSAIFKYAMEVVIFLEISGKWPEDLDAIKAIKAEFHGKMCDMLQKDGITAVVFPGFLQILWMGYFFRVQVCYLREIYLQRLVQTSAGDWKEQETAAASQLELEIEILPRLTTAIASIQADHPSFSGGVRLCKRWAASQLLTPHIPSIAVELLVAHLYLSPAPYTPPHTPHIAFLRFLRLLEQTDWKTTPFLVNLNDEFSVGDVAELNRRFTSQRATLPHMFLVTPYDLRPAPKTDAAGSLDQRYKQASLWTKGSVSLQILYRCKQLAAAAFAYLNSNLLSVDMDIKTIFRPNFNDFNVTLELNINKLNRRCEAIDWLPKKSLKLRQYEKKPGEVMPIVMFDCAQLYLRDLKDAFSHLALFFYDEHGGESIGVVWKPQAFKIQELKVGNMESHQLVGVKEVKQVPNLEAILEDFNILGADLVHRVSVKNAEVSV